MRGLALRLVAGLVLLLATQTEVTAMPLAMAVLMPGGAVQAAATAHPAAGLKRFLTAGRAALSPSRLHRIAERACLALAIYHEARGERVSGQLVVARVILNRRRSRAYPSTICGVVYQNAREKNRCQFSFACDGIPDLPKNRRAWRQALGIASMMLCNGRCRPPLARPAVLVPPRFRKATHYHASRVSPPWSKKLEPLGIIGAHVFFASQRVLRRI